MVARRADGISIVLPVYNEERAVATYLASIRHRVAELLGEREFELVVADNASTDATTQVVERFRATLPEVRCLHVSRKGRGPAMASAFRSARYPYIAILAIDRAWDERFLTDALAVLESTDASIVYGPKTHPESRVHRHAHRSIGSVVVRAMLTLLFGKRRHDTQCIKLFRAADIPYLAELGRYNYFAEAEFALRAERAGLRSAQVPVTVEDRRRESKVRVTSLLEFMREALHFRRTAWRR